MNSSRVWFVGAVCLLLAGWGATGWAQSTTNNQSGRIIIYPGPTDSIEQLKSQGVTKVEDYGSYWLARATASQLRSLKHSLGNRLQEADSLNRIELNESSFDVTTGAPAVDDNLREPTGAKKLLRIVQFKGPIVPAWIDQLNAIKNARIINYIPNNAYLVSIPAGAEASLQSLTLSNGPVQWIGTFHPAHKLPKGLRTSAGVVSVRIGVLNDNEAGGVIQELERYALVRGGAHRTGPSQWGVTMQVAARDLPAIAQIPSVLWIQPDMPIIARDELQGLVLAGDLNPQVGDSYTNYLFGIVGFLQDSAYYPVLDICDTGVDADSPYCAPFINDFDLWHPAFAPFPTFSVDPSDACCYGDRKVYEVAGANSDTVGPLGHGTAVASIAIGADGWTNEIVNCYSPKTLITTNMTISNICIITGFDFAPCVGPSPPACCITITGCPTFVCFIQTNLMISNGVCKIVTNPPPFAPFFVQRRDGQGFQMGLGISPYGTFGVSSMTDAQSDPEGEMASAYISLARISNNSWNESLVIGDETGGGNDGAYDALCQSYDRLTRDVLTTGITNTLGQLPRLQEMLFVFSAGNDNGQDPINGGFGDVLITPPATAKNVMTVGSTDLRFGNINTLSSKSSFGPTRDGRIKPDVVAPGGGVEAAISQAVAPHQSCAVDCGGFDPALVACGDPPDIPPSTNSVIEELYTIYPDIQTEANGVTSYAAPAVSGGAQLLYSYFITPAALAPNMLAAHQPEPVLPPSPAMMKAYIMNSARYVPIISPFTGAQDKLPSIGQGMGMLDLGRMFDGLPRIIRDESTARAIDLPLYSTNTVVQQTYFTASGQYYELSGTVVDPSQEFRVTLAWTDAPGTPGNGPQLVNNLDLQVTINGQTYYGNDFDTQYSTPSVVARFDALNNVESVVLPPGASGPWSIIVRATNIAGQGVPNTRTSLNQDFALVVYNANPFSVSDLPPAGILTNNTCQTALPITTYPFTWVNTLSTNNYVEVNPSPTAARGGIQEFFKIPLPSPSTAFNINTFGSSFDTVLSVWRGGCGSLVEVTSNNDASNTLQSAVSFVADGFEDYYIIAEPHSHALSNSLSGTLVLNVAASSSQVIIAPDPVLFPDQITGTTGSVHNITVQNGLSIPLQVQSVSVTGADAAAFIVLSESCSGSQLAPTNGTCVISVVFAPSSPGSNQTAALVITDSATGSPQVVPMSGNGLPPAPLVVISPATLVYSNQPAGTPSAPQTVTIQNNGSAALVMSNIVILGTAAGDFSITGSTCGALPSTIAAGGSCTLNVVFQPTASGNRFASISFTNNASTSPQSVSLIGLGCAAITVSPATLPAITTVTSYTTNFTASGGVGPYTFALSGGSTPTGVTLSPGGILTGTPTALGTFTFSVTAMDANGCVSPATVYNITVTCGNLTILPATLPSVLQGTSYSQTISVPNGIPPYTFRVTSGAPPANINLVNGTLTGTPTIAGTNTFSITATDSNGCTGVQSYTIVVTPTIPGITFNPVLPPSFGDIVVGTTSIVQTVTVINSGTSALVITNVSLAGVNPGDFILGPSSCIGGVIAPGASCAITVSFAPKANGNRSASILVYDNATGNPHAVLVTGTGTSPVMLVVPSSVNFGTQAVHVASAPQFIQVFNNGDGPFTITNISVVGVNATDFTGFTQCGPTPIQPGDSCTIEVFFTPGAALPRSGTLIINSTATNSPQQVSLTGIGANTAPSLAFNLASLAFGDGVVGRTGTVTITGVSTNTIGTQTNIVFQSALGVTVTNNGTSSLVISAINLIGLDSTSFFVGPTSCLGASIVPGGFCDIIVGFAPTATGRLTAALQVLSNSGTGSNTLSITANALTETYTVSPTNLVFGAQPEGVISAPQYVVVQNVDEAPLEIHSAVIIGPNASDFMTTNGACIHSELDGGCLLFTGESTTIGVTFDPSALGTRLASLALTEWVFVGPFPTNATLPGFPATPFGFDGGYTTAVTRTIPIVGLGTNTAPSLAFSPAILNFGDQAVGSVSSNLSITFTNLGNAELVVTNVDVSDSADYVVTSFTAGSLLPGHGGVVKVQFTPQSSGLKTANVRIWNNSGVNPVLVPVEGDGVAPVLSVSATTVDFGAQVFGTVSPVQTIYLFNIGNSALSINNITIGGVNPGDFNEFDSCGVIEPSEFCTVNIQFTPQAILPRNAVLLISSDATNGQQQVQLTGTGVSPQPILTLSPSSLNFGINSNSLQPVTQTLVIGNNGTAPLLITNITLVGSPNFSISQDNCLSNILLSTATCNLQVTYSPTSNGTQTATLQIGTVPTGMTNVTLTGGLTFVGTTTNCPGVFITVSPSSLGPYVAGATVNQQLIASGGSAPYTFSAIGSLPMGLNLSTSGVLSGAVSQVGTYIFTVQATDHLGCTSTPTNYTVQVQCPTMTLSPQILSGGIIGQPYLQSPFVLNGAPPTPVNTYLLTEGAFPPGLAFDAAGGIAGTPTQRGIFTFTVRVINATGCFAEEVYTINIGCIGLTINPVSLPGFVSIGSPYSQQFSVTNAPGPFGFTQVAGSLPAGLELTSSGLVTGIVAGTSSTFTLTATNANGCSVSQEYTLIVALSQVMVFTPSSLAPLAVGTPVAQQFTVSGGTAPITYSVVGALPAGLTLSSSGDLSGTVTNPGTATFTVLARDATGTVGAQQYTVASQCAPLTPASLPSLTLGAPANVPFAAGANSGTFTLNGSLPPGLTFNNGVISGTPTNSGTFIFTVQASGAGSCPASVTYTTTVACAGLTITPNSLKNGAVGTGYSSTLTASGGLAPYTYTVNSGLLPAGLNLSPAGLLSGSPLSAVTTGLTFQVKAADANGCQILYSYSLVISGSGTGGTGLTVKQVIVTNSAGIVTVKIAGNGALSVNLGAGNSIDGVAVTGSDSSTTLSIAVKKAAGSNGQVTIGAIAVDGDLHNLSANNVNISSPVGVSIGGSAGSVTLSSLTNSQLSVGGLIKSATIKSFVDSQVLASQVGKISLGTATPQPVGKRFGIQATVSIGSVTVKSPSFKWNKSGLADQSAGDFHVSLNQVLQAAE